jgi:uncharacterized protein
MAMRRAKAEPVAVAILAKAPIAGLAKTRLAPALGANGAAQLHARLLARTVETAVAAATGPVTLWGDPDTSHPAFGEIASAHRVALRAQPSGDLGARMLSAIEAAQGPAIIIGTDCPALAASHLIAAADYLREDADVVIGPAEDGGYVLIAMRRPQPALFRGMTWSTDRVADETRARMRETALSWRELPALWDVDRPDDLARLQREGMTQLLDGLSVRHGPNDR